MHPLPAPTTEPGKKPRIGYSSFTVIIPSKKHVGRVYLVLEFQRENPTRQGRDGSQSRKLRSHLNQTQKAESELEEEQVYKLPNPVPSDILLPRFQVLKVL